MSAQGKLRFLVVRRSFVHNFACIHRFAQRGDVLGERCAGGFQPLEHLLLAEDGLVQFLDQVFLRDEFGFDFFQAFFGHGVVPGDWSDEYSSGPSSL